VQRHHRAFSIVDLEPSSFSEGVKDEFQARDRPRVCFGDNECVVGVLQDEAWGTRRQRVQDRVLSLYHALEHVGDEQEQVR
jgi:hypothetical protein